MMKVAEVTLFDLFAYLLTENKRGSVDPLSLENIGDIEKSNSAALFGNGP